MNIFIPPAPLQGLDAARHSAKDAFRAMMNAATKTASLFTLMAEQATDPTTAAKLKTASQCWQNSAQDAYKRMTEL